MSDYTRIAKQAEASLNSYQAKTGGGRRPQADDEAGVNSNATRQFPGGDVQQGDELSTNRGYGKRIPPSEGGDLDARGRQTRGTHFEGTAGPHEKMDEFYRDHGGYNENDVSDDPTESGLRGNSGSSSSNTKDIAAQGRDASFANAGRKPPGPGGSKFKGEDYYVPESVPDSTSAEGWIPPASVTQTSRESERP
ncbi:hypothetical protein SPI_06269 [Niveomyces insectorum RCEF 264]|uniref:Uncharacterized protein n=1 Tax=Niveomyces insectorum RCEF 264 TaxID=1081102 RepID=A0A167RYR8_9HYPO|nr:hypothetical protein SPI_06269 [Niveomyces insectorum RCEF 264]